MEATNRFASVTTEEIKEKKTNICSKNTIKANRKAAKMIKDYLTEKSMNPNFESLEKKELNEFLVHFYLNARKVNGEKYKVSSLENMRHSLNRYLQAPPLERDIDIIKDIEFREANLSYRAAVKELKQEGNGTVDHFPVIKDDDIQTLYKSLYFNVKTPCGLQNKVQFDVRLYFCRRGAENMHSMTNKTFVVRTDENGSRYICKAVDEFTKNHRENDKEAISGFMPEIPGSELCPVNSFIS